MSNSEFFFYLIAYASILTYLVLGFIIAFESLLALYGVKSALKWIKEWHSPKLYKTMLIIFLPMIHLGYIFLEILPYIFGFNKEIKSFNLDEIYFKVFGEEI